MRPLGIDDHDYGSSKARQMSHLRLFNLWLVSSVCKNSRKNLTTEELGGALCG